MRVIYLHQYFNTPQMSGSTRSYEMARRLVATGHKVHMITTDRTRLGHSGLRVTDEYGITVHWLPVPYSNCMSYNDRIKAFLRFAWKAAGRAASIPGDVVFATSTPLTVALPAAYAARRQQIPMVFEVRDLWPELPIAVGALQRPLIPPALLLERFAYRNAAQIVALSPGMKDGIVCTGYPSERVHVIPNGADLDLFSVPASEGIAFRSQSGWLQDRPLLVYTGTLGRINGVDYLARLAAAVQPLDPEIRFLVVGEGAEKQRVLETARQLDVYERNFFIMSSLPKAQIPTVLSAADIATSLFVDLSPMWTNSANKFFDALASGTPVAINYLGWQAKLLEETGAGIVLDVKDINRSAAQLLTLIQDRERLVEMGKAARRVAEEYFSRDHLVRQLEHVLLLAVEKR
ncbi:MAG: glycosyltransferase family 4 protein [Ardenticatenaceae bacterium]|nr:glycosyltransferase family 4 protein [Ardenticatenaceae bacterium]